MKYRIIVRGMAGGVGVIAVLLLLLASHSDVLAGQFAPVDVPSETAASSEVPESTTEPAGTSEDEPGGIVVSPTDIANDGVAPGQVDLVISTSDGGMLPAGTTACIGEVCQTLSSDQSSGFKWRFERMKEGWQEIRIRAAGPYDGAVSSVRVQPGGMVTAHVEIVRVAPSQEERPANTPPPAQNPPPANDASRPGNDDSTTSTGGSTTNADGSANPDVTQRFSQVTDLPETGSGSPAASAILAAMIGVAGVLLVLAAIVHHREMWRRR